MSPRHTHSSAISRLTLRVGSNVSQHFQYCSPSSSPVILNPIVLIGAGLLYLTFSKTENWRSERTKLHAWPLTTIFWLCSLAFVIIAPFFRNTTVTPQIPWYIVPTIGTSILVIGPFYWFLWARVWPRFGYAIEHEVKELPDGSEVVKYVVRNSYAITFA